MKKKDVVQAVPQSIRIPVLNNTSTLENAEGPVSLLCCPKEDWQTFIVSELLPKIAAISHPNELLYFNPRDAGKQRLLSAFSELFNTRFENLSNIDFSSTNPTDWSIALRNISHLGYSDPFFLILDNLDQILESPLDEQQRFATLITHIACEPNLNVLAIINRSNLSAIQHLRGFEHLSIQSPALSIVPDNWQPPQVHHSISRVKDRRRSAFSSNLLLSSTVVISIATLSASFWIANRMNPQLPRVSARNKTIQPEGKAAMRSINVASAKEIDWGRPSADRQALNREIMLNPIQVAFTNHSPEPSTEIKGQLASKINIEAVEAYQSQFYEQINTKSILSFQPVPNEDEFFSDSIEPTEDQEHTPN